MPNLIHCHECDKPTANSSGICDNCETSFIEGSQGKILSGMKQLENRLSHIEQYYNIYKLALYEIAENKNGKAKKLKKIARKALDPFDETNYGIITVDIPKAEKESMNTTNKNIDKVKWVSPQDPGDEHYEQQAEIYEYDRKFYEEEEE